MPTLEKGYKSFRFDRRFRGIGELRKSSGTDDPKLFDRYNMLLDDLYADPDNHDVIQKVIDGTVTIAEVYTHFKNQTLTKVKKSTGRKLLSDAFKAWLVTAPLRDDKVRGDYQGFMNQLLAIKLKALVSDLPSLLKSYYATSKDRQQAYNHTRNAALAFLRDTEGKRSPIYLDVQDTPRFKKPKAKNPRNPFTVKEVIDLCARLTSKYQDVVWSCFLYGMGPKEYMNGWNVERGALWIDGTKNDHRPRWVPLLSVRPIRHQIHPRSFAQVLKKAAPDHVPYDLRRGYSKMLENAGIVQSHSTQYMGHAPGSMTETYQQDVDTNALKEEKWEAIQHLLPTDAKLIEAYTEQQREHYKTIKESPVRAEGTDWDKRMKPKWQGDDHAEASERERRQRIAEYEEEKRLFLKTDGTWKDVVKMHKSRHKRASSNRGG